MAKVTMTLEEYQALLDASPGTPRSRIARATQMPKSATAKPKRTGKAPKGMSLALKKANAKARKKDGSFKKGYDQARVMRDAHKIRRRMK